MNVNRHVLCNLGKFAVPLNFFIGRARNDQRGSSFVYKNRVNFVDNCEVVSALYAVFNRNRHVVTEVVETKFVVGSVSYVCVICGTTLLRAHTTEDHSNTHAEKAVNATHPFGVVFGQIIVDRNDVHTFTGECIQINRQRCDQGLAFTGLHFCDIAAVERSSTHQLHLVVPLAQDSGGSFPYGCEGFG